MVGPTQIGGPLHHLFNSLSLRWNTINYIAMTSSIGEGLDAQ